MSININVQNVNNLLFCHKKFYLLSTGYEIGWEYIVNVPPDILLMFSQKTTQIVQNHESATENHKIKLN